MNDIEKRFDEYLKNIISQGLNSTDKLTMSRYFNGQIENFYTAEIKINPSITRTELVVTLAGIRIKYQYLFVGI